MLNTSVKNLKIAIGFLIIATILQIIALVITFHRRG